VSVFLRVIRGLFSEARKRRGNVATDCTDYTET